jgi:cytochrome c553
MELMLLAALTALPFAAAAQDNATARSLAATCANCHGTDGRAVGSAVAGLAGMPKDFIVQRMNEFKSGKRPATVMHQLAKGYTDQQIELMAGYFAAQKR